MSNQPVPLVSRMLRLEWLGQTVASLCWIVSVFLYGIESVADMLQLAAASSWLVANIASLVKPDDVTHRYIPNALGQAIRFSPKLSRVQTLN